MPPWKAVIALLVNVVHVVSALMETLLTDATAFSGVNGL